MEFLKNNKFAINIIIILILLSGTGISAFFLFFKKNSSVITNKTINETIDNNNNNNNNNVCFDCVRRLIDGVYVKKGEENYFPYAVMVENHLDARPQSGLSRANLVFEAEAEAGITRFLAIYANNEEIKEIGPVRSARAYYLNWVNEFNALYVHCGGSPEALAKIIKDKIFDFNEFYRGSYFWREPSRSAPHNVYISSKNIKKYLKENKKEIGNFDSWQFKEDLSLDYRPATSSLEIYYRSESFLVKWEYNKEKNDYQRFMAGNPHLDKDGSEIRAKNILVQYVNAYAYDEVGRLKMDNIGSGKAIICLDGECFIGKWLKSSNKERIKFYNQGGDEVQFNAGPIWIEVIRNGYKVLINNNSI